MNDPARELAKLETTIHDIPPQSLVMAYAPWCPACKMAAPEYLRATKSLKKVKACDAVTINVDTKPTLPVKSVPTFFATDKSGKLHELPKGSQRDAETLLTHLRNTIEGKLAGGFWTESARARIGRNVWELLPTVSNPFAANIGAIKSATPGKTHVNRAVTKEAVKEGRENIGRASDEARSRLVQIVKQMEALGVPPDEIARRFPDVKPVLQRMGHLKLSPVATPKEDLIGKLVEADRRKRESAKKRAKPKSPPAFARAAEDDEAGLSVLEILERRKKEVMTGSSNTNAILTSLRHIDPRQKATPKPKHAPPKTTPKTILKKLASMH